MKEENILAVPVAELQEHFDLGREYWKGDISVLDRLVPQFAWRPNAEHDYSLKQLIPYAIFRNPQGRFLSYRRCGSEKRLSGLCSIGIGGHVNEQDRRDTMLQTLMAGLKREIREETGIRVSEDELQFAGFLNEERTEAGRCHLGLVFIVDIGKTELAFDSEIAAPEWIDVNNIKETNFELWSFLALKLLNSVNKIER